MNEMTSLVEVGIRLTIMFQGSEYLCEAGRLSYSPPPPLVDIIKLCSQDFSMQC